MSAIAEPDSGPQAGLRAAFLRDGYVVVEDDILDGIDVAQIWQGLPELDREEGRVQDGWQNIAAVRAIAGHPKVLETLRTLYGRRPIPFQTLNFKWGTEQRTHSDAIHFSSFPFGMMCGVWVALEDVTLASGPLRYYPGSQMLPDMHYDDFGIAVPQGTLEWTNPATREAYKQYEDAIAGVVKTNGFAHQDLALKRGSFLVWAANLLHGGAPRLDAALSRKSQVTHYYFEHSVRYIPMFSRPQEGRYRIRHIRNVLTGRPERATFDGKPVLYGDTIDGLQGFRVAETAWDHVRASRLARGLGRLRGLIALQKEKA